MITQIDNAVRQIINYIFSAQVIDNLRSEGYLYLTVLLLVFIGSVIIVNVASYFVVLFLKLINYLGYRKIKI